MNIRTIALRSLGGIFLITMFTLSSVSVSRAQELTLRLATEISKGGDIYLLLDQFKKETESHSNGKIKIKLYFGGSLGNQRQLQEQLQLGTIEAIGTGSNMVELEPKFGIFDLPFLFKDRNHVYRALDGELGVILNKALLKKRNLRVIAFGEIGFRQITNAVRPIMKPSDLKGLKIRTPSNKLRISAFKRLGAAPTPISYKELYTSLQQKVVDGQENPVITIKELSLWDVQKFVSLTNHVYTPAYLVVNESWWQKLSVEQRKTLMDAAEAAQRWQRNRLAGMESDLIAEARSKGMQIDSPDLKPFAELTRPVWKEFEDRYGSTLIDLVMKAR